MFSKIVLLAVVALAVSALAARGQGKGGAPDAAKSGEADGAKTGGSNSKMGEMMKDKMTKSLGGDKKEGCWKKAKECCPSMSITKPGAWKDCNATAGVTCKSDCVFEKSDLLSADKLTVDMAKVNAALDKMTAWPTTAITDAKAKCTASAPNVKPDDKKKCVTGAHDVLKCLMKALLVTCPDATASTEECKRIISEAVEKSNKKDEKREEKMKKKSG